TMNVKEMTRARAEQIVASTNDEEVLWQLEQHENSHVRMKVLFKRLGSPSERRNATAIKHLGAFLQRLNVKETE
ncbi:hypothetical protein LCGC14_1867070, partial [marine sediment metagenome]